MEEKKIKKQRKTIKTISQLEIAKEIAPSNDEDGVAYIVEKNTLCD